MHLWLTREAYEDGEASIHFFNGRTEPRWVARRLTADQEARLAAGELVEVEDPGYLDGEEASVDDLK